MRIIVFITCFQTIYTQTHSFRCIHKGQWAVSGNKGETFLETYKL